MLAAASALGGNLEDLADVHIAGAEPVGELDPGDAVADRGVGEFASRDGRQRLTGLHGHGVLQCRRSGCGADERPRQNCRRREQKRRAGQATASVEPDQADRRPDVKTGGNESQPRPRRARRRVRPGERGGLGSNKQVGK